MIDNQFGGKYNTIVRERLIKAMESAYCPVNAASTLCYRLYHKDTNSTEYRMVLRELHRMKADGIVLYIMGENNVGSWWLKSRDTKADDFSDIPF